MNVQASFFGIPADFEKKSLKKLCGIQKPRTNNNDTMHGMTNITFFFALRNLFHASGCVPSLASPVCASSLARSYIYTVAYMHSMSHSLLCSCDAAGEDTYIYIAM